MMGTSVVKGLTIKHRFYTDENFLNYFASKMIFQNILQNVVIYCIYLNIFVLLLYNFTKCFSDARVYEIVDNCLSLVQNICSMEKLIMLEVVGNVFTNNLVFICRIYDDSFVFVHCL